MGVELTKRLAEEVEIDSKGGNKPIEYNLNNIIMDGDTTTIFHIHENVSKEIGV